jgi:hypothetical protein
MSQEKEEYTMDFKELKKKARNIAYHTVFVFCERSSHWPTDPEGFLQRAELAHKKMSDIAEPNSDGECMYTLESFEDWLVSDIVDLLDDMTANIITEFKEN